MHTYMHTHIHVYNILTASYLVTMGRGGSQHGKQATHKAALPCKGATLHAHTNS